MSAPEQPTTALTLTVNSVIGGVFFPAGSALPFGSENDLPTALRPFIASEAAPPLPPPQRNIYDLPLSLRRQVHRLEKGIALREAAEEVASEPLPPETAAALQASHELYVGAALKQAELSAQRADDTYKQLEAEAAAKVTQFYVRRGGAWEKVQNSKLKPGETVFVKRENGEMEAAGVIDSRGEPPPRR
jgi:hypothetical protein